MFLQTKKTDVLNLEGPDNGMVSLNIQWTRGQQGGLRKGDGPAASGVVWFDVPCVCLLSRLGFGHTCSSSIMCTPNPFLHLNHSSINHQFSSFILIGCSSLSFSFAPCCTKTIQVTMPALYLVALCFYYRSIWNLFICIYYWQNLIVVWKISLHLKAFSKVFRNELVIDLYSTWLSHMFTIIFHYLLL